MEEYQDAAHQVLSNGQFKPNRTGVSTISNFSVQYDVDVSEGYPLLTTKKMDGFRWNSMIHELLWYLSGEEHVRNLREKTGIWDEWATESGHLDTAYGRFWRRFPVPDGVDRLEGESWPDDAHRWVSTEEDGRRTFDQIQYVLDSLSEAPQSRRLVVSAWHPANAAVSTLPPCHYSFVFNVQGDKLNLHLTQRSADVALGVPFNIAAYALLLEIVSQRTSFEPGVFSHQLVDAHLYCGVGGRADWYQENIETLCDRVGSVAAREDYLAIREWVAEEAPDEAPGEENLDHVPGMLTQLSRAPKQRPEIEVVDKPIERLEFNDISLRGYESAPGLEFAVAE